MESTVIRPTLRLTMACELRRNLPARLALACAIALVAVTVGVAAQSADHAPAQPASAAAHQEPAAAGAPAEGQHEGAAEHAAAGEHDGLSGLLWPVANFVVLCGALYYFFRTPLAAYLGGRSSQIRKDLLDAAELNRAATAQLAAIDRKMHALPGEIEALKARGAQEIVAEEERIAGAAAADRARLLTQTRREIEVRLQSAKRELSDHAADLALNLATQRLSHEMTPADHTRLVDRYVTQVKER
jgi:F0F1-type ATP synthase membrane subunit b/b'